MASAGGLSYSGITNYGKVSLPSVEEWGTNMNIIKDPSRSIMTRKKDKVGANNMLLDTIDNDGSRIEENILKFARGVNPSVSVEYSNHGNTGGHRSNGLATAGGVSHTSAKLPYRIMDGGAFRPPVMRQEQLLPLSRQSRPTTKAYTNPEVIDYTKRPNACVTAKNAKEIRTTTLKGNVKPTAVYRVEKPMQKPHDVKYTVQPKIKTCAHTNVSKLEHLKKINGEARTQTRDVVTHAKARTNAGDTSKYIVGDTHMDTTRYVQDVNAHAVSSNTSSKMHAEDIEYISDLFGVSVRDQALTIPYATNTTGVARTKYIHEDIKLARNMPEGSMRTNRVGIGNDVVSGRQRTLRERIQPGSFVNPASVPKITTHYNESMADTRKTQVGKFVSKELATRYLK